MSAAKAPTVAGATLRAQLETLATMLGPHDYDAACAELTEGERAELAALATSERAPATLATRVLEVCAERTGRELDELREAVLEERARANYRSVWGSLLNPSNEETLASRAAAMVHRAYDRGEVVSATTDVGRCDLLVSAWPAMPEHALHELRVAFRTVLELTGHQGVRVTAGRTPQGALYKISWKA